jgi:cytochrome b subunit of formate dehydrogenase
MKKTNMFSKLIGFMGKSAHEKDGKPSSSRISSYFILGAIVLLCLTFVVIEIINGIVMWRNGGAYIVPWEHITIFGMILAHHLALLQIKKSSEVKIEQSIKDRMREFGSIEKTKEEEGL